MRLAACCLLRGEIVVCLPACFPPSCFSPPGPASGHHSNPGLSPDCCCCCCIVGCCRSPQPGASDQRVRAATEMPSLSSCSFMYARDARCPSPLRVLSPDPYPHFTPHVCRSRTSTPWARTTAWPSTSRPCARTTFSYVAKRAFHTWLTFFANNVHCPRPIIIPQVGQLQCLYLCSLL